MRIGAKAVLALLLLGALSLAPPAEAETVAVSLKIPGETSISNAFGQPVLVAGLWHQLSIALENPVLNDLAVEASSLSSPTWDMTSFYRWIRNEPAGSWSDPLYSTFIDPSLSTSTGREFLFYVGVDANAQPGTWRLGILRDTVLVTERLFEVRPPKVSYGLSVADFVFRVAPFTEAQISTEATSQYLRIINDGNVPLKLSVSFDILQGRLTVVNPQEVAHILQDARYYLYLSLDPRPPQIINIEGTARVEVQYIIPSPGAAQIIPSFENEFPVKVVIGRIGYIVESIGNVIFQTIQHLQADFNSLVAWQVFLTGEQQVLLDVAVSGVRFVGAYQGDQRLTLPAILTPTPDTELPITVQIMTDIPSVEAQVAFTITLLATEDLRTFVTIIAVGPRAPTPIQPSHLWLFASLISASVIALVSYNHWRLGGTGDLRKPLGKKGKGSGGSAKGDQDKDKGAKKDKGQTPTGKKKKKKGKKGRPGTGKTSKNGEN